MCLTNACSCMKRELAGMLDHGDDILASARRRGRAESPSVICLSVTSLTD